MAAVRPNVLRPGGQTKVPLKEKIVQIYEALFRGENPALGNSNFWDELFLLRVNPTCFQNEFDQLDGDALVQLKDMLNELFFQCVRHISTFEDSPIRIVSAIQTLCCLIRGMFSKSPSSGFDVINVLIGFDKAQRRMKLLVDNANGLLSLSSVSASVKEQVLHLLLVLVTATENISQNVLLEYVMGNSIFESLTALLADPSQRLQLGHDAILLLTLLVQYRKYESANPYIVQLSILDDEFALNGYAHIISAVLSKFNRDYCEKHVEQHSGGIFSALTNMVGSMFVTDEKQIVQAIPQNDAILLTLYEAIHLNRNFNGTLTQSHDPAHNPLANSPLSMSDGSGTSAPSTPTTPKPSAAALIAAGSPTNLLITFLEYSSIIIQDLRNPSRRLNAKLCLTILTCVTEDQYANSLMHDVNLTFRVPLHRTPMRHRKVTPQDKNPLSRPLAAAVMDLMVEFMASHLMKSLPVELYMKSLGVIHRLLCYQKKCRVRLQYQWKNLWAALITLLKFIVTHDGQSTTEMDSCLLALQVINLFNLFITFGDTFLPSPTCYDDLYYELVRTNQTFDNLYQMGLQVSSIEGKFRNSGISLTNSLVNIRAIVKHFTPRIEKWAITNDMTTLSEDQVLEVVRGNYDSLTLKLHDTLDQYDRYSEKPQEMQFFLKLVRQIVSDVRQSILSEEVKKPVNLKDFISLE